ncbi:uncharacterized protein LOC144141799 isoform X2 [Haemaphysalis longicornis]
MNASVWCVTLAQLLFVTSKPDCSSACNTQLPSIGPRLFRAKALFGDAMRLCKSEILRFARKIPPEQLGKLLQYSCSRYNICKGNIEGYIGTPLNKMFSCLMQEIELKVCLRKFDTAVSDLQTLDDTVAFARIAVLTYGWT